MQDLRSPPLPPRCCTMSLFRLIVALGATFAVESLRSQEYDACSPCGNTAEFCDVLAFFWKQGEESGCAEYLHTCSASEWHALHPAGTNFPPSWFEEGDGAEAGKACGVRMDNFAPTVDVRVEGAELPVRMVSGLKPAPFSDVQSVKFNWQRRRQRRCAEVLYKGAAFAEEAREALQVWIGEHGSTAPGTMVYSEAGQVCGPYYTQNPPDLGQATVYERDGHVVRQYIRMISSRRS